MRRSAGACSWRSRVAPASLAACAPAPPKPQDQAPLVWPEEMSSRRGSPSSRRFRGPRSSASRRDSCSALGEFLFGETGRAAGAADGGGGGEGRGLRRRSGRQGRAPLRPGGRPLRPDRRRGRRRRCRRRSGLPSGSEGEVYVTDSVAGRGARHPARREGRGAAWRCRRWASRPGSRSTARRAACSWPTRPRIASMSSTATGRCRPAWACAATATASSTTRRSSGAMPAGGCTSPTR